LRAGFYQTEWCQGFYSAQTHKLVASLAFPSKLRQLVPGSCVEALQLELARFLIPLILGRSSEKASLLLPLLHWEGSPSASR
jgi:hypothetical protein